MRWPRRTAGVLRGVQASEGSLIAQRAIIYISCGVMSLVVWAVVKARMMTKRGHMRARNLKFTDTS